jgi:hypothetical protein
MTNKDYKPSKPRQYLVVAAIKNKLPFWHYKLLAEWLDCYQYVLPSDRELKVLPILEIRTPVDCLELHNLTNIILNTMSVDEQVVFSHFIGKSYVSRIPKIYPSYEELL